MASVAAVLHEPSLISSLEDELVPAAAAGSIFAPERCGGNDDDDADDECLEDGELLNGEPGGGRGVDFTSKVGLGGSERMNGAAAHLLYIAVHRHTCQIAPFPLIGDAGAVFLD